MKPYYDHAGITIYHGDCREIADAMPEMSVDCIVSSPPYWRLRDYGEAKQLGLEDTPEEFIDQLTFAFSKTKPLLTPGGTLWLNIGDTYAASGKGGGGSLAAKRVAKSWEGLVNRTGFRMPTEGYKQKDLVLTSFGAADALRYNGWYLRSTIVWEKASATEPPRQDRPSQCHEYFFLLSKDEDCRARDPGNAPWWLSTVWSIRTDATADHPATMPLELASRAIVASTRTHQTVLDPFIGSGTSLLSAKRLGRRAIGIEVSERYCEIAAKRLSQEVLPLWGSSTSNSTSSASTSSPGTNWCRGAASAKRRGRWSRFARMWGRRQMLERCPNHPRGINIPATFLFVTRRYCKPCAIFMLKPIRLPRRPRCNDCMSPAAEGVRCAECAEQHRQRNRKPPCMCGGKPRPGRTTCVKCSPRARARS